MALSVPFTTTRRVRPLLTTTVIFVSLLVVSLHVVGGGAAAGEEKTPLEDHTSSHNNNDDIHGEDEEYVYAYAYEDPFDEMPPYLVPIGGPEELASIAAEREETPLLRWLASTSHEIEIESAAAAAVSSSPISDEFDDSNDEPKEKEILSTTTMIQQAALGGGHFGRVAVEEVPQSSTNRRIKPPLPSQLTKENESDDEGWWKFIAIILVAVIVGAFTTACLLITILLLYRNRCGGNKKRQQQQQQHSISSTSSCGDVEVVVVQQQQSPSRPPPEQQQCCTRNNNNSCCSVTNHAYVVEPTTAAPRCCYTDDDDNSSTTSSTELFLHSVAEHRIRCSEIVFKSGYMGPQNRLGIGGYGEVFKASWLGTPVAVKRLFDHRGCDSTIDFAHEVSLLSRLRHPHVVLWMGVIVEPSELSIVMEYMDRGSLSSVVHRRTSDGKTFANTLTVAMKMSWVHDIVEGMAYLHGRGIVHRDLTSNNVLLNKKGQAKITDFGLSKVKTSRLSPQKRQHGAAYYCAPEALGNDPYDYPCDVFSFGVIVWELMHRQRPFYGIDVHPFIAIVQREGSRFVRGTLEWNEAAIAGVPQVKDIALRCWLETSKDRPTFQELVGEVLFAPPSSLSPPSQQSPPVKPPCKESSAEES